MAIQVTMRRHGSDETITGTAQTDSPAEAIARVAKRKLGWAFVGTLQHFPGGDTYHAQSGQRVGNATSLGSLYIVHIER